MHGLKIMMLKVVIIIPLFVLAMWMSTHLFAQTFGYNPRLGEPLAIFSGFAVYKPWMIWLWMFKPHGLGALTFHKIMMPLYGASIASVIVAIVLNAKSKISGLSHHGSARWATNKEIKDAGLNADSGVMLGLRADEKYYLRHAGPEHICVFAPTRSGKGVGLVVPTLLTWRGSVVCFDPKAENWQLTSGFRSGFSRCIYFDPTSEKSARFNPLFQVRKGLNEIKDVQNIADILVDPEGSNDRRSHWDRTAHSLLVGVILHVLYAEPDKSLAGVANFLSDPSRSFLDTLRIMMSTMHLDKSVHPVVAASARELLNKAENERSGVLSTAMSFLGLYRDPVVALATSSCDFQLEDLLSDDEHISLYLVVPPSDLSRVRPLVRLILNQMGRRLTEKMEIAPARPEAKQLLLLLDEFPSLGRLDFFETSLAYIAGYGIRAFLITQSLNQIEKIYGANNSILDNCHIRVAFAANDDRTAKRISDLLGTTTETKDQQSISGRRSGIFLDNTSISEQSFARALLTPSEVNQLASDKEIVFAAGVPPILAKKLVYFTDELFKKRILPRCEYAKSDTTIKGEWHNISPKIVLDVVPFEFIEQSRPGEKGDLL